MATKINKVLVTGSSGFIGGHLMKALGERGIPYDIQKSSAFDILNPNTLKAVILSEKPKCIVHLAAISNAKDCAKDSELAIRTNLIGTFNVMRLAYKYKIKVIIASSAATKEPELSLYATTKDCMERMAAMFDNVIIARFYNVYGPGSKSVVNKFVKQIRQGKEIVLNGNTKRDYVYIDDLVASLVYLIDAPEPPLLVEIGTGRPISLHKLVSIVSRIVQRDAKVKQGKPIKEIQNSQCNYRYGRYQVTLEQGVKNLYAKS